jgi:hypothetical protein
MVGIRCEGLVFFAFLGETSYLRDTAHSHGAQCWFFIPYETLLPVQG